MQFLATKKLIEPVNKIKKNECIVNCLYFEIITWLFTSSFDLLALDILFEIKWSEQGSRIIKTDLPLVTIGRTQISKQYIDACFLL